MSWNYRVWRYPNGTLALKETYYTDDEPDGWTECDIIVGETVEELQHTLNYLSVALAHPILDLPEDT